MSRNMSSFVTLCVAAFVTFYVSDALAAQNETYSAYAAQNQVTDAILSRDGTTFMTFATERGKPFLRGWRIAGSDATQIGRIEIKDLRMPTRSPRPFPYSDINKDFASFKKTFALSPDGNLIARVECLDIDKIAQCQRLSILDWKGKTVKDTKDKKKDGILLQYTGNVPGERSCGLEFSPNGERLYFCSEGSEYSAYIDHYSRIHVFDTQLRKLSAIDLGPTARPAGAFPGRALIEQIQIGRDNKMLVVGEAYASNNNGAPGYKDAQAFDSSRGTQIWRIDLGGTNNIEYHYDRSRPADADDYAKTGNYLDATGGRYAALVGRHLLTSFGPESSFAWKGEVFGEAKRAKGAPPGYVSEPASSVVSDDGRMLFGYRGPFTSWWIVGPGAGPVLVRQNQNTEDRPATGENILAVTLAPGSYASLTVTNRRLIAHDAPGDDLIATATKYAEAVDQLEAGFTEAGVKGIKDTVSAMPSGWVPAASNQLHDFSNNVMRGEKSIQPAHMGELLRHSALTFHAQYKQDNADSTLRETISLWNQFGLHAAMAGNPIVVRQAADKLKPLIAEMQTRKAGEKDQDRYNHYPLLLESLAVAIEKSPDSAYDHLLAGGKLSKGASTTIGAWSHAYRPLYSNLTKLAYLTDENIEDLERDKPKTPQPPPAPYPDADGKLIPALTVFQPGAATASQPEPDSLARVAPPPTPGGQVID